MYRYEIKSTERDFLFVFCLSLTLRQVHYSQSMLALRPILRASATEELSLRLPVRPRVGVTCPALTYLYGLLYCVIVPLGTSRVTAMIIRQAPLFLTPFTDEGRTAVICSGIRWLYLLFIINNLQAINYSSKHRPKLVLAKKNDKNLLSF